MIKAEWTNADTLDLQPTCNQLATDCVSRQAAIDVAKEELDNGTFYDIPSKIESLPPAQPDIRGVIDESGRIKFIEQPEQKKGKWIEDRLISTGGGTYGVRRCSECEAYYQDVGYGWNYCPNCGTKMEE